MLETLGLVSFIFLLFFAFSMAVDFIVAARHNGVVLRRKIEVWAALTFVFAWVVAGRVEQAMDFYPGVDVAYWCRQFQWIPNGVAVTALARLWYALHLARRKKNAEREE